MNKIRQIVNSRLDKLPNANQEENKDMIYRKGCAVIRLLSIINLIAFAIF